MSACSTGWCASAIGCWHPQAVAVVVVVGGGGGRGSSGATTASNSPLPFIGILDIFGFEIFEANSFEQLCINYANEKLQSLFNHHIFVAERDAYREEGLDISSIAFTSNATCVELLEARGYGLLPALDEVTTLGREDATDTTYLERIDKMHRGRHPNYEDSRRPTPGTFSVAHFAGRVRYSVEGFLEKNNDTLHADLEDLVRGSEDAFVRELFAPGAAAGGGEQGEGGGEGASAAAASTSAASGAMVSTIAGKFKSQLQTLYDLLLTTSPHYIRCIKPNPSKRPLSFARRGVLDQLLYCGVLETIRIRQQGYPHREDYLSFWRRACKGGYTRLLPPGRAPLYPPLPPPTSTLPLTLIHSHNARAGTLELCSTVLAPGQWAQGRTLLFLRAGGLETLERALRAQCCTTIQAWWRGRVGAGRFRALVRAVVRLQRAYLYRRLKARFAAAELPLARLQAAIKGRAARKAYGAARTARHAAATLIAATVKSWQTRGAFLQLKAQAVRLQAFARWMAARREVGERRGARDRMGGFLRMVVVRKRYLGALAAREKAAAVLQALARGRKEKAKYAAFKFALRWLQNRQRCAVAKALAARRRGAAATIHAFAWRAARKREWRDLRATVVRLQAWWRGRRGRAAWVIRYAAAHTALRFLRTTWRNKCLRRWCDALFGALAWGDRARARQVLLCGSPEYALMGRSVPLACRLNLRNPRDGFKSPLHAAFIAGGPGGEAVTNLLLSFTAGAPNLVALTPRDRGGNTPLHRGAAAGDGHLPSLKALHEALCARGGPGGVGGGDAALALVNGAGEYVLGTAVNAATSIAAKMGMGGGSSGPASGSPTHARTIAFLLSRGAAHTGARALEGSGGGVPRSRVEELGREVGPTSLPTSLPPPGPPHSLSSTHPHPHYDDMAAIAASVEIAKATEAAREADPHFAFFLVREKERKRRERDKADAVLAASKAAEAEAAAQAKERHFPFVLPFSASASAASNALPASAPGGLVRSILTSTSPNPTYINAGRGGGSGAGAGAPSSSSSSSGLSLKRALGPRGIQQQRKEPHILTSLVTSLGVGEDDTSPPPTSPPQPYSKPYYPLSPTLSVSPSSPHPIMSPRLSQPHAFVLISTLAAHLRGGAQMALLQLLAAQSVYLVTVDVDVDSPSEAISRALAVVPPKARGVYPMLFSRQPKPPGRDFTYLGTWEDVSAAASVGGSGLEAMLGGLARVAPPLDYFSEDSGGGAALSPIQSGGGNSSSRGTAAHLSPTTHPKPMLVPASSAVAPAALSSPRRNAAPTGGSVAVPVSPRPPPPRSVYSRAPPPPSSTSPRLHTVAAAAVSAAAKPTTTHGGGPVGSKLGSRVMAKLHQESAAKKAAIAAAIPLPKRPVAPPPAAAAVKAPSPLPPTKKLSPMGAAKERELRRGPTGLKNLLNSPSVKGGCGGNGTLHALNFGSKAAAPPPPPPPPAPFLSDDLPSSPPRQEPSLFLRHQQQQHHQHSQPTPHHSPHSPTLLPSKFLSGPSSSSSSSHLIPSFQGGLEARGMGGGGGGGYTTRWEVRQSLSTGMPYYLDTSTGATQWEQPKNLWEMVKVVVVEEENVVGGEQKEEEQKEMDNGSEHAASSAQPPNYGIAGTAPPAPATTTAHRRPPPPIPDLTLLDRAEEWDVKTDKSGRPYFVCKALGVSSWLMPPCLQALDTRPQPLAHLDVTYGAAASTPGSSTRSARVAATMGLGVQRGR